MKKREMEHEQFSWVEGLTLRHKYDKMDTKDLQQIYFLNWRK
jgi:hypothetical protein